jgi:hypothetical protein
MRNFMRNPFIPRDIGGVRWGANRVVAVVFQWWFPVRIFVNNWAVQANGRLNRGLGAYIENA